MGEPGAVRRQREHRHRPGPAGSRPATGSSPTRASFRPDLAGGGWKGCVMARAYPTTSTTRRPPRSRSPRSSTRRPPPTTTGRRSTTPTGQQPARKGPNLGCGTPITPLTKSRATIEAGIAAMKPWRRGGTTGNLGLAWGWRTISPSWRGLWGDPDLPLDYGTDYIDKVVVLLTDGNNEFYDLTSSDNPGKPSDFTAYGRVNAPGPVRAQCRDDRRRRLDPQFAHDRSLHRDEGRSGRPRSDLHDHLRRRPERHHAGPVRGLRDERRPCTTMRRRPPTSPPPSAPSAASSPTC